MINLIGISCLTLFFSAAKGVNLLLFFEPFLFAARDGLKVTKPDFDAKIDQPLKRITLQICELLIFENSGVETMFVRESDVDSMLRGD